MRKRIFLIGILVVCGVAVVSAGTRTPPPSAEVIFPKNKKQYHKPKQMIFDTYKNQAYFLYLPMKYRVGIRCPMIVALDPSGNGKGYVKFWKEIAERYGYVVLGPVNDGVWNAGQDRDIAQLIEMITRTYLINKKSVFVTGFSGGGVFGYCVTINYPHIVKAFAPVCSCMFNVDSWLKYSRAAHTPILIVHGENDDVAGKERGEQAYEKLKGYGYRVTYMQIKGMGHELRPEHRENIIQFFEKWRRP